MKRKWLIPCLIVVIVIAILFYTGIQRTHTFTLAERNGVAFKSEQIQPLFEMRHSVENYIIFILLFSVNCIILYPKYFSYGENGIFVEQSLYITYTQTYL